MQFPLDPNMSEWVRPRLNRRNPQELHWRREPPEWHGNSDQSHGHLYSHLADKSCCMQCGAIPCPFDHDEHKRLKLADLEFVKELAKERRELRERVAKMDNEIQRLKMLNTDHLKRIQSYKKDVEKLRILTKRVENLEKENASLKDANKRYQQLIVKQTTDIETLEVTNKELTVENQQSQYHIRKLQVQCDESRDELIKAQKALGDTTEEMLEMQSALKVLTQELAQRVKDFNERDEENHKLIKELRNQIQQLMYNINLKDLDNNRLRYQVEEYLKEIEMLRSKLSSDTRFKQFVTIKRENTDLKERNDVLKFKVYEQEKINPPIPFMTAKGRIKSGKRSISPSNRHPVSASCSSSILNRPKSAVRCFISQENTICDDF